MASKTVKKLSAEKQQAIEKNTKAKSELSEVKKEAAEA